MPNSQQPTQSQALNSLASSVSSLRSSLSLLDSSITILSQGTSDFPRLKKVLSSTRHFELTPSTTLQSAQQSLATELAPAIKTLLLRCETHLSKLERREGALIARAELLEGRLGNMEDREGLRRKRSVEKMLGGGKGGFGGGKGGKSGAEEKELKLKMLRQKKERLGYAVERLGLQSEQRQRQLRKSVAAGTLERLRDDEV
ncbi:Spc19-domain-containing protein [Halenospora varia]|nr:Spc19-domain-containing protein [Halenospora varia]